MGIHDFGRIEYMDIFPRKQDSTVNLSVKAKNIDDVWWYFRILIFRNDKIVKVSDRFSLKRVRYDPHDFIYTTQVSMKAGVKFVAVLQIQNKDTQEWIFNHSIDLEGNVTDTNPYPNQSGPA